MEPIQTLIADDERLSRQRIRHLLRDEPHVQIVGECTNGTEALEFLSGTRPDLIFLDVQMPGLDGFDVVSKLIQPPPMVVFITAYDEYALRAFDVHAFDYLLKPFDRPRFQETMRRVREQLSVAREGQLSRKLNALVEDLETFRHDRERIAIRTPGHITFIRLQDVDWIEAADNYVCIHCGTETHVLRETMNSIESRLPACRFQRVHRSAIVNVDRIKELQPWFRGDYRILLQDGTHLTLSRSYRERLEQALLPQG